LSKLIGNMKMFRVALLLFVVSIIAVLPGCKGEDCCSAPVDYREIAWNSLSSPEQATVDMDWRKAKVEETTFNNVSVHAVTFNTTQDALLGPIIIYIDSNTHVVLGKAARD
jgi:hypothetical protein